MDKREERERNNARRERKMLGRKKGRYYLSGTR
jgi:hypothetical protein